MSPTIPDPLALRSHRIYAYLQATAGMIYNDPSYHFLQPSTSGNVYRSYSSTIYSSSNHMHAESIPNRIETFIMAAYKVSHRMFSTRCITPELPKLDYEASQALQTVMGDIY
jgi:hypothetical protein